MTNLSPARRSIVDVLQGCFFLIEVKGNRPYTKIVEIMYLKDIKEITRILEIIRNYLYVFPAESVNRSSGFFVISL